MKLIRHLSLRIKVLLLIITVLVLGGLGYSKYKSTASSKPQYQTTKVEKGTLIVSVTASGQMASVNSASVTSQASGVVSKVYVSDGQSVKAGAPLAKIELDAVSKLAYNQALTSYLSANNSLASAKNSINTLQSSLYAANQVFINDAVARGLSVDDPTYIQQHANWLAAENNYKNQQNVILASSMTANSAAMSLRQVSPTIYAPISGTISGLSLQEGTVISSSGDTTTKVANLTTTAKPSLAVNLTEIDVMKIKPGNKVTITLDAYPDKTYTGKVVSVDTVGTVSSGVTSYPVVIVFDTLSPEILSNMAASASIITATKTNALLVPSSAVKTLNGESTVQLLKADVPETVTVEIGLASDTQTEILSGLNEGDMVITSTISSSNSTSTQGTRTGTTTSPFGATGNRGFSTGGAVFIQGGAIGR